MCSVQPISSVRIQPGPKTLTPSFRPPSPRPVAVRAPRVYSPGSRVSTTRANALVPMVIESSPFGERAYDIFSRLLKERIICVNGQVTDAMAHVVVAQLLFLDFQSSSKPVYMYINSPGGSITAVYQCAGQYNLYGPSRIHGLGTPGRRRQGAEDVAPTFYHYDSSAVVRVPRTSKRHDDSHESTPTDMGHDE